jgi:hypothetical protein
MARPKARVNRAAAKVLVVGFIAVFCGWRAYAGVCSLGTIEWLPPGEWGFTRRTPIYVPSCTFAPPDKTKPIGTTQRVGFFRLRTYTPTVKVK